MTDCDANSKYITPAPGCTDEGGAFTILPSYTFHIGAANTALPQDRNEEDQ